MGSAPSAPRPPDRIDAGPILLRRWTPDDAPALLEAVAASHAHLRPWMPWALEEPTLEEEAGFIARMARAYDEGAEFAYGMFTPADGALVGACALHVHPGTTMLEIGYWVHAGHTRRGYATAAARALTEAALALPGVTSVEIHCDVANTVSASVPHRLGFRLDRVVRDRITAPAESGPRMVWVTGG
ncbi:MAG TPA: GNAT family N-acetyltransferase [Candidatus Dormibacteraeota bacterium]